MKELKKLEEFKLLDVRASAETEFCFRAEFCQDYFTDEVGLSIHYYANIFDEEQIDTIGGYYINVLQMMVDDVYATHDRKSICGNEELKKIENFRGNNFDIPSTNTFWNYYEQVLCSRPDKIAFICGNNKITYRQLDERINIVANSLIKVV